MTKNNLLEAPEAERRHLRRLETLVDVIFAMVIVFVVAGFPSARDFDGDFATPWEFLKQYSDELITPGLGLILIILYWAQSNIQLGRLERTDPMHATLVIVQMVLLLTYVYSFDFYLDFPGDTSVLTAQSVIFVLMGTVSYIAWQWAIRGRRLVNDDIENRELLLIRRKILPEPLTAFITIWFSFLGSTAWELAWLAGIPISIIINWIAKKSSKA